MNLLNEEIKRDLSEEAREDSTPKKEEENFDIYDYDYNKRIWF